MRLGEQSISREVQNLKKWVELIITDYASA